MGNHALIVDLLLQNGAEIDAQSQDGETPLHESALRGNVAVVELFIKIGAKINKPNFYGLARVSC